MLQIFKFLDNKDKNTKLDSYLLKHHFNSLIG